VSQEREEKGKREKLQKKKREKKESLSMKTAMMEFRADPFESFRSGDSPIAIHARRRWMGTGPRETRDAVAKIRKSQGKDGSWDGSVARTIESLFALTLLDKSSPATSRAIEWLITTSRVPERMLHYKDLFFGAARGDLETLRDTPFTTGCSGFVQSGAILYFASLFGADDEARITGAFKWLNALPAIRDGRWCSASCSNNILQAFAVTPKMNASEAMRIAVDRLAKDQLPNGAWRGGVPFYPTLNALGRVPLKAARKQLELAACKVAARPPRGVLNAFLMMDALERGGLLT
jgi:hypothetical protein